MNADLERLAKARHISLPAYRRDGTPVACPVWVTTDGSHWPVWTGKRTGKAKRLRHTERVTVAPCDPRGRLRGAPVAGTARLLPDDQLDRVERSIARKYRIGYPALRVASRLQRLVRRARPTAGRVGVEIPLPAPGSGPGEGPPAR